MKSVLAIFAAFCFTFSVAEGNNNYYIVSPSPIGLPQPVYYVPIIPVVPAPPPQLIPAPIWMQPMVMGPPVIVAPPQVIVIENRWEQRRPCFPILFPRY